MLRQYFDTRITNTVESEALNQVRETEAMEGETDPAQEGAAPTAVDPQCLCPLGGVMDLLARKYAIQVVCVVGALGPVRYAEIETAFGGVSSSTLSARLGELTEAGLLERERYAEIPPRVEYTLSEEGEALADRLRPLLEWAAGRNG